jgi:hypothetical protein
MDDFYLKEVGSGFIKFLARLTLKRPGTVVAEIGDLTGQDKGLFFPDVVRGI